MIKSLPIIFFSIVLAGCAVRFPQVQNILHSFADTSDPISDFRYFVVMDIYESELIAIKGTAGIVYANQKNDALLVKDGVITQIQQLGLKKSFFNIEDVTKENKIYRKFYKSGKTVEHICDTWSEDSIGMLSQTCKIDGEMYRNERRLNQFNQLVYLSQVIDPSFNRIVLSKK